MSDDRAPAQDANPAPDAVDDRQNRLLAGLDALRIAITKIPTYEKSDIQHWTTHRNTYWHPPLRQLDELCHLCAELYPAADVTQDHGYTFLRRLIQDNLCDVTFDVDLFRATSAFQTFRHSFGNIRDEDVWLKFFKVIALLKTASQHFTEELRSAQHSRPRF